MAYVGPVQRPDSAYALIVRDRILDAVAAVERKRGPAMARDLEGFDGWTVRRKGRMLRLVSELGPDPLGRRLVSCGRGDCGHRWAVARV